MDAVLFAEWVFYLEGILNIFSGFLLTAFPSFCMATQGLLATSALANANLSQFGSLVVLLGVVGVRCTPSPQLIEALLLGDFLWMAVFYREVDTQSVTRWTPGALFSFWITGFLASVRMLYLYKMYTRFLTTVAKTPKGKRT